MTTLIDKTEFYDIFLALELARIETDYGYYNPKLEQGFDSYVDNNFDCRSLPIKEIMFTLKFREILYNRARKAIKPDGIKYGDFCVPLVNFKTLERQWKYPYETI
jgi:hypothetical protein